MKVCIASLVLLLALLAPSLSLHLNSPRPLKFEIHPTAIEQLKTRIPLILFDYPVKRNLILVR